MPRFSSINQQSFLSHLKANLSHFNAPSLPSNIALLESQIDSLTNAIVDCARASKEKKPISIMARNMPWWSTELCALRTKVRLAYRAWFRDNCEENRAFYKLSKANFQRELRRAKAKSWKDFRSSTSPSDLFRELAEFTGKSKTISLPDAITIDGVVTSDSSIIVTGCANHFFPESYPSTNAHLETENTVKTALSRPAEAYIPPISDWEFEAAISSLKPKSSAGVDGIPATLLLLSVPLIKTQLLLILNASLLLCYFPDQWKVVKVSVIGKQNKKTYDTLQSFRPTQPASILPFYWKNIGPRKNCWDSVGPIMAEYPMLAGPLSTVDIFLIVCKRLFSPLPISTSCTL